MNPREQARRIAVISTPRVGNTWLNYCVAKLLDMPTVGVHRVSDLDNVELLEKMVLQVHGEYEDVELRTFLNKNNFKVVTVSRHPLDVFISILHFVQIHTSPLQWLDGKADVEKLYGLDPSRPEFITWCLGEGAGRLLSVSYGWSQSGHAELVKYEDLIDSPVVTIKQLTQKLGYQVVDEDIEDVLAKFSPGFFKKQMKGHGWKSKKDNWKGYFTAADSLKIYRHYKKLFDTLGYEVNGGNSSRRENVVGWDIKPKFSSEREYLYQALVELERQIKPLQLEKTDKDFVFSAMSKNISELQKKSDEILANKDAMMADLLASESLVESLKDELESIRPLNRHLKKAVIAKLAQIDASITSLLSKNLGYRPQVVDLGANLEQVIESDRRNFLNYTSRESEPNSLRVYKKSRRFGARMTRKTLRVTRKVVGK